MLFTIHIRVHSQGQSNLCWYRNTQQNTRNYTMPKFWHWLPILSIGVVTLQWGHRRPTISWSRLCSFLELFYSLLPIFRTLACMYMIDRFSPWRWVGNRRRVGWNRMGNSMVFGFFLNVFLPIFSSIRLILDWRVLTAFLYFLLIISPICSSIFHQHRPPHFSSLKVVGSRLGVPWVDQDSSRWHRW